ncbi:DUF2231 domain-containing protein [Actinomarinicola tropica]|uniref:DUF2231 domain-containing protein n=1 Tax=Actinomarinicola tropica TaxID=2789776 RepID=A0A5Q2RSQ1_9ACTN|nr:DUF2231 domain-containing protein [Actinomarinicola tropica]QGG96235.1 DUF2231 domain-containing protein [Actinomarinicola tropica]
MQTRRAMPPWLVDLIDRQENDARLDSIGRTIADAAAPLDEGPLGPALRGEPLGHRAHPMLTDLPIGFFTSAAVVDLIGGKAGRVVARRLIGMGLLSAVPTAMAGAVDYRAAHSDPRIRRVGVVHGLGNVGVMLLYFRSWRSRRRGHHLRGLVWGALGAGAATFTGYLGGHLSYALGANVQEGGATERTPSGEPVVDLTRADGQDLLDVDAAAERLGVSEEDVQAMVDQDVLVPVDGGGFRPDDVEAVRLQGG